MSHISLTNFMSIYKNIILSYFDFLYTQLITYNNLTSAVFNSLNTIMWRQWIMRCGQVKMILTNLNF